MKKILIIMASLLAIQNGVASNVTINTDTLNFIHVKRNHWQEVYGVHNIRIVNNSPNIKLYHFIFKICIEGWRCTSHEGDITLNPSQSTEFGDKVIQRYFASIEGRFPTHAETILTGDGYWHSEKNGIVEVVS